MRLAMAWNGGVSLAIWMGGIAAELDAARRARRPDNAGSASDRRRRSVYAALSKAFDRELVIDIINGASAGGLNGALLAAAIEKDEPLRPNFLRDRWLEIGDFDLLLQPIGKEHAPSFMQGELFYTKLKETFKALLGEPQDVTKSDPAKVLLDVQVTDVEGDERAFVDDWNGIFYAREYRAPVRFRLSDDYTAGTLAAAARASASFPGAFEAQALTGRAARLAGFPDQTRWAIDGGLLENAPIRPAIDLIPTRPASAPVKRFVCYVNAHPRPRAEVPEAPSQPQLAKVISYNVKLPRVGRTIDQLTALEDARRRGGLAGEAGVRLLAVEPADALRPAAEGLLQNYQNRRALLSLTELLEAPGARSGPGLARQAMESLGDPTLLPWIPASLEAPQEPAEWRWGIRAAQRILQLELDLLRAALLTTSEPTDARRIFRAREPVDAAIGTLEGLNRQFVDPDGSIAADARKLADQPGEQEETLRLLSWFTAGTSITVFRCLKRATSAFYEVLRELTPEARRAVPSDAHLFGAPEPPPERPRTLDDAGFTSFVALALQVEVIRRSFSDDFDIESAQKLSVAQLTPNAPTVLLAPDSLEDLGPCSPEEKLTGIRLGHFAAFYRSSWRANDFMWGRLDGASNAVRLLVDTARAKAVDRHSDVEPWALLADALVPKQDDPAGADERELIRRVLYPNMVAGAGAVGAIGNAQALQQELKARIRKDLREGDGTFTAAVCTRAIQYSILRDEATHVRDCAAADSKVGAHATSLDWNLDGSLLPLIDRLRAMHQRGETLPAKLGRDDPDESTSALGLRTLSHAGLVALSALRGVVPLARVLQPARVPLFALQGMAARRLLDRLAVVVAFTGATWYLVARWLTMPADPKESVPLDALWSPQVLALWVCILTVLGVLLVPAVRAIRTDDGDRRVGQGLVAFVIAVGGGGLALGWQWWTKGTADALTAAHAGYSPFTELLWVVAGAGGLQVASRFQTVNRVAALLRHPIKGFVSTAGLTTLGIGGTLAWVSMDGAVGPAFTEGGWKTAIAILAIVAPAVVAFYLLSGKQTILRSAVERRGTG